MRFRPIQPIACRPSSPPFRRSSRAAATYNGGAAVIAGIDHFVLTVRSVDDTCAFYQRVLGFRRLDTPNLPTALLFGTQKINVHEVGRTFEPKAKAPTPGTADFCLVAARPLAEICASLEANGVAVEVGPVERIGARGPMMSVYFRDPDGNLVEVSDYGL
ncbi:VOC family protein [Mesorhizobium sp. M6A.T.Ce.TU.002.03.1.1]|uniref:VOC family virulence protein n=1 Tax=Mesorhizobium mediterraneum TaxID=43617 RepID=A0AB36RG18_9HYPH|nr:VOC family virulence protein [Mesorhizobium mediterraneum]RUU42840.1 VOC family protein [Mesorhizobium sp. M6A.T.Ce.TU.002.03.1.1]RUU44050.1 VOC family protein [Mesorhizobium sp. M6A.T.Ca.TU.002.02.2.1]RUV00833.1 VOC family protein [Mesorhizobium sp. M6A.T.Cr.TU.017.01.1.1]RVB72284.1 VOC family protein [Mesorhizobium sp. M6A.T.Cr.TU.014.01.1.1]RWN31049.1 MAG: VOC family protein [Mesorhizobium sp.]